MTRHDELRRDCNRFHAEHPEVWDLFVKFTMEKVALGYDHYGVVGVFERLRWETNAGADVPELNINSSFRAFYARRFNKLHPHLGGGQFFRLRAQTSLSEPGRDAE